MKYTKFRFLWLLPFVVFTQSAFSDKLSLYVYPSPLGIDWRTPSALAWTAITNSLVQDSELHSVHSIGHMNFHLRCSASSKLPAGADIEIGQTGPDSESTDLILKKGYGLGVLISDISGYWESAKDIEEDLRVRYERGTVAFMDISIQPATCARIVAYLKEYKDRGYNETYGGLNRKAREGHGAGCSSFAESVLEIGGIMAPQWRSYWHHSVRIPWVLIGGPLTGTSVTLTDTLVGPNAFSWGRSSTDSELVDFWDPYFAYWWIQYASQTHLKLDGMTYHPVTRGNATGLIVNAMNLPTPSDGFWISNSF